MMGHMTPTDHTARVPACRKPSVRDIDVQGWMGQMLCIAQGAGPHLQDRGELGAGLLLGPHSSHTRPMCDPSLCPCQAPDHIFC